MNSESVTQSIDRSSLAVSVTGAGKELSLWSNFQSLQTLPVPGKWRQQMAEGGRWWGQGRACAAILSSAALSTAGPSSVGRLLLPGCVPTSCRSACKTEAGTYQQEVPDKITSLWLWQCLARPCFCLQARRHSADGQGRASGTLCTVQSLIRALVPSLELLLTGLRH